MSGTTVVNAVKDRSKTMRRCGDEYEWGWLVFNKRDRSKDYFNKVGAGTYEEALKWMSEVGYEAPRRRVLAHGPSN